MQLSDKDWQLFHAYPRLVDYLMETTYNMRSVYCARLKLHLSYARIIFNMCKDVQKLAKPSNYPGPKFTDQHGFQEQQVAELIASHDPDFYGMVLGQRLTAQQKEISYLYADTVIGSEADQNCDLIVNAFRQAGFRVPAAEACH